MSFPSLHTAFIIAGFPKKPRAIRIITNSLQSSGVKSPEIRRFFAQNTEK
jgi:hypothetical protein